jgi:hypothetical protein
MRKLSQLAAVFAVAIFSGVILIKGFVSATGSTTDAPPPTTISVGDIQRSIDTRRLSVTQADNPF